MTDSSSAPKPGDLAEDTIAEFRDVRWYDDLHGPKTDLIMDERRLDCLTRTGTVAYRLLSSER